MPMELHEATSRCQCRVGVNGLPLRATSVSKTPSPTRNPWSKGEMRASAVLMICPLSQMNDGRFTRASCLEPNHSQPAQLCTCTESSLSQYPARKFCGCSSVVEHLLAKENVARSNRVTRSISLREMVFSSPSCLSGPNFPLHAGPTPGKNASPVPPMPRWSLPVFLAAKRSELRPIVRRRSGRTPSRSNLVAACVR